MSKNELNQRVKGWKQGLQFIFERLDEGLRPADFRREEEEELIPHSTLHIYLNWLKTVRVAYKDERDGKWYFTCKKEKEKLVQQYQQFANYDEFKAMHEHSVMLIERLRNATINNVDFRLFDVGKRDLRVGLDFIKYSEYFENFRQHLESGYPQVYELYNKNLKEVEAETVKINEAFQEKIEKYASQNGFEIKKIEDMQPNKQQISSFIFIGIKKYCEYADEPLLKKGVKLEEKDNKIFDPIMGNCISLNTDIKEKIENLIESCVQDNIIRQLYSTLTTTETNELHIYSEVDTQIAGIIRDVKSGGVLKGSCGACMITIGRE